MEEEVFKNYLKKLNLLCQSSELDDVSPTSSLGKEISQGAFYISKNMDIDSLSTNNLYLMHSMLHTFYGRGGSKELDKQTIEKLHRIVKEKISHSDFDRLDRVE